MEDGCKEESTAVGRVGAGTVHIVGHWVGGAGQQAGGVPVLPAAAAANVERVRGDVPPCLVVERVVDVGQAVDARGVECVHGRGQCRRGHAIGVGRVASRAVNLPGPARRVGSQEGLERVTVACLGGKGMVNGNVEGKGGISAFYGTCRRSF